MKKHLFFSSFLLISFACFAQTKTWNGPNLGTWNTAANWLPVGVPGPGDTVIFNSSNHCDVDINTSIASLRTPGSAGGYLISTGGNRVITINNNGASSPVLNVASGSFLVLGGLGGTFGVSITTYGGASPNNAQIDGNLSFGYASTWTVCNAGLSFITNVDVSGIINPVSLSTPATLIANTSAATFRFLNGSLLGWGKNGGSLPVADYQDGSTINIYGTINVMPTLSSSSNYNGLIIWNSSLGQTISGSSAVLLPSATASIDSLRVFSTGTGTLRLFTEPAGYTIGHLEVQGGTVEISAPVSNYRTGNITTDFKISGGTVYGNATYAGDATAAYPMTLTVNGNFTMTGGTLNLTNRPTGLLPAGAFQLNVKGNVSQTAGSITSTSAFGSQNYIMLNGTLSQNLQMSNVSGPVGIVINNAAGVVLQAATTLPYALNLFSGILTTTNTNLLNMAAGSVVVGASNSSFVDGPVKKTGNTAFTFPVGKTNCGPSGTVNGYAALAISNFTGGAVTDQYTAEYKRADALGLGTISNAGLDHVSRCDYWTLTRDLGSSTVDIALSWSEPINNCVTTAPYINNLPSLTIAHNNNSGGTWDVIGVAGVTTGNAAAGSVTWNGTQSASFGAFAIGSTNFQNPLPVLINYFTGTKQNGDHLLSWKLTCNSSPTANMILERSSDGRSYAAVYNITVTALQCQQPFRYTDANPAAGINYYRLKVTDANGKITYSSLVSLINGNNGFDVMNISPNPVTGGRFNLKVSAAQPASIEIVITDMQGRILKKQSASLIAGFTEVPVNVSGLAGGTYQVSVYSAGERAGVLCFVKP